MTAPQLQGRLGKRVLVSIWGLRKGTHKLGSSPNIERAEGILETTLSLTLSTNRGVNGDPERGSGWPRITQRVKGKIMTGIFTSTEFWASVFRLCHGAFMPTFSKYITHPHVGKVSPKHSNPS